MQPKLILLDWDGTLADVFPITSAAINATLQAKGQAPLSPEELKIKSGLPLPTLFPDPTDRDYFIRTHARLSAETPPTPLPGANEFIQYLSDLRAKGAIAIGIISNKPRHLIEEEAKRFGWQNKFDVIVGSNDVALGKPHIEPFIKAQEKLPQLGPILSSQILYIGDTNADLEFARTAGIRFCGIGDKISTPLNPGETQYENLSQLHQRIKLLIPDRTVGKA